MKIYVDADACPVVRITEEVARRYGVELVLLCDTNHVLSSGYASIIVVDAGADAVDLALVNRCGKGDVVVTQDYGVAAMALSRGAYPIHQSGMLYTQGNIEGLLNQRYEAKKARRASAKNHWKGPPKRREEDDRLFRASLEGLLGSLRASSEAN